MNGAGSQMNLRRRRLREYHRSAHVTMPSTSSAPASTVYASKVNVRIRMVRLSSTDVVEHNGCCQWAASWPLEKHADFRQSVCIVRVHFHDDRARCAARRVFIHDVIHDEFLIARCARALVDRLLDGILVTPIFAFSPGFGIRSRVHRRIRPGPFWRRPRRRMKLPVVRPFGVKHQTFCMKPLASHMEKLSD